LEAWRLVVFTSFATYSDFTQTAFLKDLPAPRSIKSILDEPALSLAPDFNADKQFSYLTSGKLLRELSEEFSQYQAARNYVPYKVAQTAYEANLARSIKDIPIRDK
jgi:hypothetical protein